jgi:hypothetical protein
MAVTAAREVPDMSPRSLEISGPDFRSAIEVLINEENSPSFVIASKNIILAQVPDSQKKAVVRNISVLSAEFTATYQSRIQFRLGRDPKKATGLKAMMQMFLKILLATPGADAFATKIGGGALKNIGKNFAVGEMQTIISDFAIAVRRTEGQIKALQSQQSRLPDDERLLAANILNAKFDIQLSALIARVELIAQSGTRAIASLEL